MPLCSISSTASTDGTRSSAELAATAVSMPGSAISAVARSRGRGIRRSRTRVITASVPSLPTSSPGRS